MSFQLEDDQSTSLKTFVVLSKAYKTLMDRAVKDMKQNGLSPSEFTILELLYTKGRIPLQQIGEKILITSGSITYNIDKLEKKGLIKRVHCEEDRRVIYAEITPVGYELFDLTFPGHAETIHSITQGLSLDEKQDIIKLLKKLGKGM
ncbi:MarR family 2-MHQ and catechol resistance regulon transcriptional repressor [Paenibacillus sp. V4I3]|uniref:MarR family winged helix-turn-helix transcriptional regulator n=1 Tax=unclassified Paenibacillus TaxID=185978 RepID=UPI002787DFE1|nr:MULTISPECIES: MarR family transcriptional regulator [unclassified Paenibacillus]MDQ0874392.1 MarR family 2-MHQ and catechol resistance regulon transcriptional repressor [Paenibacillus sp. V4I3]MDQ0889891.1 MarR family 2-MHQ and catechol resistance regulon transcriptional repressor [Paenibacillus sp. V4I9]